MTQNIEIFQKLSPWIWNSYKFILNSVKSPNQILWAMECWFKALKCQISLRNRKAFFWENEGNIETFKNFLPIFEFSIICFQIFQEIKSNLVSYGILFQGFKMPHLVVECKTYFLGKRGKRWSSPKAFSVYLVFYNLFWSLSKA